MPGGFPGQAPQGMMGGFPGQAPQMMVRARHGFTNRNRRFVFESMKPRFYQRFLYKNRRKGVKAYTLNPKHWMVTVSTFLRFLYITYGF